MVDTNANTNGKHETKNAIMRDHYLFISYEHRTQDTQDRTLKLILKMMKSPRENQKKEIWWPLVSVSTVSCCHHVIHSVVV